MKETMKDIILNASADMTESCHKTDFIVSRGERCFLTVPVLFVF